jgi:nicotinamidase-related amidase
MLLFAFRPSSMAGDKMNVEGRKGLPPNAALIIIDVQRGFDEPIWGHRNNDDAEGNIAKLLRAWRTTGRPVIHVKHMSLFPHSPLRAGQPGNAIKDEVAPVGDEPVIKKAVNSAFIGTDLEDRLKKAGIHTVVMTGLTTDHCVSTTARMAGNLGFDCYVVADATATFDRGGYDGKHFSAEEIHETSLASLGGEFATIIESDDLLGLL